ncbi:hypothetical protein GCM10010129_04750 [Streptomyces fumigatiscleroticus]|nr:hypothetical protein GCM10010129_04750 [Streptomyces fumigatiscleroticus]
MTDTTVRIDGNALRLPGGVTVRFVRTLRLPGTGTHPLPPGLGEFPVRRVADHARAVPEEWRARGGVLLPVYPREAMWLGFDSAEPTALQVGAGTVCAVSGGPWNGRLSRDPQNYLVLPRQPWLDGIASGTGTVRQFVAALGELGGVRLQSFPLDGRALTRWRVEQRRRADTVRRSPFPAGGRGAAPPPRAPAPVAPVAAAVAGLGAGGILRQEVHPDDRPLRDWAGQPSGRVFAHLVTPRQWRRITGEEPPPSPVDRAAYTRAGLPWFDRYDQDDAEDTGPVTVPEDAEPAGDGGR